MFFFFFLFNRYTDWIEQIMDTSGSLWFCFNKQQFTVFEYQFSMWCDRTEFPFFVWCSSTVVHQKRISIPKIYSSHLSPVNLWLFCHENNHIKFHKTLFIIFALLQTKHSHSQSTRWRGVYLFLFQIRNFRYKISWNLASRMLTLTDCRFSSQSNRVFSS